jgi:hypothetical protein
MATLTLHQGGRSDQELARLYADAHSALDELAGTLPPGDYLLLAIQALSRCLEGRKLRLPKDL